MSDEGLDAEIGLLEAVAVQVGIVIGAGLFSVTGVAIGSAGPGVAISYVVAMVAVSLSLVPTAILGSLYPTVGGNYRYPSRLWSPRVAFLAVWGMAVSVLGGGLPLYGLSFGQYLNSIGAVEPRVAGGLGRYLNVVVGADPQLVGGIVITAFFLVNLVGIEPAARVQQLILITLIDSTSLIQTLMSSSGGTIDGGISDDFYPSFTVSFPPFRALIVHFSTTPGLSPPSPISSAVSPPQSEPSHRLQTAL